MGGIHEPKSPLLEHRVAELEITVASLTETFNSPGRLGDGQNVWTSLLAERMTPRTSHVRATSAYTKGIRYIERFVTSKGDILTENDVDLVPSNDTPELEASYWVKVVKAFDKNREPQFDKQEIIICNEDLLKLIRSTLSSYIEHTAKAQWEKKEVSLKPNFTLLVLNYETLLEAATKVDSDTARQALARRRLYELLQIVRDQSSEEMRMFIDEYIMKGSTNQDFRISWKYVWAFFQPGSLIVAPWHQTENLQVFKVHSFQTRPHEVSVTAWIWDWNGKELVRTLCRFDIEKYDDTKSPTELPCVPIQFCPDIQGRSRLKQREQFIKYTYGYLNSKVLLEYDGDIITGKGEMTAAMRLPRIETTNNLAEELFEIRARTTLSPRCKIHKVREEIILDTENYIRRSGSIHWLGNVSITSEKLCSCALCIGPDTSAWKKGLRGQDPLTESENNMLLPPRISGFSLGRKEWCQFYLDHIIDVPDQQNISPTDSNEIIAREAAKSLILPEDLGDQAQGDIFKMIATHSRVMSRPSNKRVGDVIGGKGESLILLFHGQSGTGKTLYAEWLAKHSSRPLFKVGISEIGLEPAAAERSLKEIFELAELWKAVLLIDEADVLLDARGAVNEGLLSKNALVSVLLREVEYFRGVLIMTTNRVSVFDVAVLSRIHHAVNFQATTAVQEPRIWRNWIKTLTERDLVERDNDIEKWLKDKLKSKARKVFCGREIRNIFIQAQAFAAGEQGDDFKINEHHLDRAYEYRLDFNNDTYDQRLSAQRMYAQGKSNDKQQ